MGLQKSQQSDEGQIGVEAVDAVAEVKEVVEASNQLQSTPVPDTRAPSTLTYPRGSGRGARCISNGGNQLFSALNPPAAPGRTFSSPSPANEDPASMIKAKKFIITTQCSLALKQWKYRKLS